MTFICHSDGSSSVKIMLSRMQVYLVWYEGLCPYGRKLQGGGGGRFSL